MQQQEKPNPTVDITEITEKMKALMQNRVFPKVGGAIITNYDENEGDENEDGIVRYTRHGLDQLIKQRPVLKLSANDTSDDGYFNNLLFMFQIYIAFINALTNTANMSASVIFGNLTLQDAFSEFLVNVLNGVLKTNVTDLTPEQLRDLLQKNRPVLQQISGIIIDEASRLLVGLSDVCKQIAMDVLPGLVKSAAIVIPSAVEAAIPPLGEVVDIVNTTVALLGWFMKLVGGIQRNSGNIFKGYGLVENAYKSLQNVQNLLTDPSAATSAVLNPNLNVAAQDFIKDRVSSAESRIMPHAANRLLRQFGGGKKMKSRRYLKDPKKFKTYISNIRNKTAKKEAELINSIRELKNM
jgi:hypothetical protein